MNFKQPQKTTSWMIRKKLLISCITIYHHPELFFKIKPHSKNCGSFPTKNASSFPRCRVYLGKWSTNHGFSHGFLCSKNREYPILPLWHTEKTSAWKISMFMMVYRWFPGETIGFSISFWSLPDRNPSSGREAAKPPALPPLETCWASCRLEMVHVMNDLPLFTYLFSWWFMMI